MSADGSAEGVPEDAPAAEEAGRQGQGTRARQQDGDMASQGNDVEDGEEENRDGDDRQDEDSQSTVPAVVEVEAQVALLEEAQLALEEIGEKAGFLFEVIHSALSAQSEEEPR